MKIEYRGFEIKAKKEQALGGWDNIYYTIMRKSDGWFLCDSFTEGDENVREFTYSLRNMVDDYLKNPEMYDEDEELEPINYCWDCFQRIGEECGIDGHEIYPETEAPGCFEEH